MFLEKMFLVISRMASHHKTELDDVVWHYSATSLLFFTIILLISEKTVLHDSVDLDNFWL